MDAVPAGVTRTNVSLVLGKSQSIFWGIINGGVASDDGGLDLFT